MSISDTFDNDAERRRAERLDIARGLYQALISQNSNRAITLCDGEGRVVARHHLKPEQRAEKAS
jgi:hypothetical protein